MNKHIVFNSQNRICKSAVWINFQILPGVGLFVICGCVFYYNDVLDTFKWAWSAQQKSS